jgi:hypothetical protein
MLKRVVMVMFCVGTGCAPTLRQPVLADASWAAERWPGTTLEDLQRGRSDYVQRCSGCHTLPNPEATSPTRWSEVFDTMANEAKLSGDSRERVRRFIVTLSSRAEH